MEYTKRTKFLLYNDTVQRYSKADLLARTWLQVCREIEEPEHVFIMDVREDGSLGCEDLWIFSNHYAMRVKDFIENEELEVFGIVKPLSFMKLKASDYDFKDFDARSKLSLTVQLNQNCKITLNASPETALSSRP